MAELGHKHVEETPRRTSEGESNNTAQLSFPARIPALLVGLSNDTTIDEAKNRLID